MKDKQLFITPFMEVISKVIQDRILSWEWNKEYMTPEQHWMFWEHKNDKDYFEKWAPLVNANHPALK